MKWEKLKENRERFGYSGEDLAQEVLVTEGEIQYWEEGWCIKGTSSGEIKTMADIFRMTEEELCEMLEIQNCDDTRIYRLY